MLLITSRETRRWVIPKGWAEKGVAPHEQAAREAFEEAGLQGEIGVKPIGSYRYLKRLQGGQTVPCRVDVFPLTVDHRLDDWPEKGQREATWLDPGRGGGPGRRAGARGPAARAGRGRPQRPPP